MHGLRVFALVGTLVACGQSEREPQAALDEVVRDISEEFDEVPRISTGELDAWLSDASRRDPLLLDVREPEEFAVSHLPGAIRVDPDATAESLKSRLKDAEAIVVYCSVGHRSSVLAQRLIDARWSDVKNLEGSIFQWANEGRAVVDAAGKRTPRVHPYNERYGRLLKKK